MNRKGAILSVILVILVIAIIIALALQTIKLNRTIQMQNPNGQETVSNVTENK